MFLRNVWAEPVYFWIITCMYTIGFQKDHKNDVEGKR